MSSLLIDQTEPKVILQGRKLAEGESPTTELLLRSYLRAQAIISTIFSAGTRGQQRVSIAEFPVTSGTGNCFLQYGPYYDVVLLELPGLETYLRVAKLSSRTRHRDIRMDPQQFKAMQRKLFITEICNQGFDQRLNPAIIPANFNPLAINEDSVMTLGASAINITGYFEMRSTGEIPLLLPARSQFTSSADGQEIALKHQYNRPIVLDRSSLTSGWKVDSATYDPKHGGRSIINLADMYQLGNAARAIFPDSIELPSPALCVDCSDIDQHVYLPAEINIQLVN